MYKAALFDLDGTLADTFGDIAASVKRFLAELGYPARTKEEVLSAISFGRRDFILRSLPEGTPAEEIDRYVRRYTEIYQKHFMDTTLPYPGLPELIARLKAAGMKVAVVTNKAHVNAVQMVTTIYPDGLFDRIRGLSDLPAKPDPAVALETAEILGVSPADCAFIGDSELDMLTAKNAGMTPIGVSWGYRPVSALWETGASAIAHSADELEALLLK
ncbi:MAG: HAD family hydrolase [Clostridia bacterium]|nr:HAD family hydrolase [Clostridia bacterium]